MISECTNIRLDDRVEYCHNILGLILIIVLIYNILDIYE